MLCKYLDICHLWNFPMLSTALISCSGAPYAFQNWALQLLLGSFSVQINLSICTFCAKIMNFSIAVCIFYIMPYVPSTGIRGTVSALWVVIFPFIGTTLWSKVSFQSVRFLFYWFKLISTASSTQVQASTGLLCYSCHKVFVVYFDGEK